MIYEYIPQGVCSKKYTFDIENNKVNSLKVEGGCEGNLAGISKIVVGLDIDFIIERFSGTDCHHKGTSCPDQIARALKKFKENN